MTYKETDVIRFRWYENIFVGRIVYVKEVLGIEYYMVATDYRTYTISEDNIIEKL